MYKSLISSNIARLYLPICIANSSLKSAYLRISAVLIVKHSAILLAINKLASKICLVATFEFNAANFWTPTNELGSGLEPSLASFKPVTVLIMSK